MGERPEYLHLNLVEAAGRHLVSLEGELDMAGAVFVRERLEEIAGSVVVVDLAGLSFVDASGIAALVSAKRAVEDNGDELLLCGASERVRLLFELLGLSDALEGPLPESGD